MTATVNAGVPQGSVSGPKLCFIFVNDISENLLSIARLFADDTSLSFSSKDLLDIEGINHDLRIISAWAKQWLVDFNPAKTEAILFSLFDHVQNPQRYFDNILINFVDNHKHLGVTLSHDGNWHDYVDNILRSVSEMLGILRSLKFKLQRKTLNQLYISYIRPLIEYASVVWDSCTLYEKHRLELIQYEAARLVSGLT